MKTKIVVLLLTLSLLFTTSLFGDNYNYYGNYFNSERVYPTNDVLVEEVVVTPLPNVPVNEPEPVSVDSPSPENSVDQERGLDYYWNQLSREEKGIIGLATVFSTFVVMGVVIHHDINCKEGCR